MGTVPVRGRNSDIGWDPNLGSVGRRLLNMWSGKTELGVRDFVFFAKSHGFNTWVLILPDFIHIKEDEQVYWGQIHTVGGWKIGDVMGSRWGILVHGDLPIPEFSDGTTWRPIQTIGVRCSELGLPLWKTNNEME